MVEKKWAYSYREKIVDKCTDAIRNRLPPPFPSSSTLRLRFNSCVSAPSLNSTSIPWTIPPAYLS